MSDSSLLSNEASLSSSDSLDSFSHFAKLKPYNFEPTVSDNENKTERLVLQLCKQRKLKKNESEIGVKVENARPCLTMLRVCAAVRKMNYRMKFITVTFFISNYVI